MIVHLFNVLQAGLSCNFFKERNLSPRCRGELVRVAAGRFSWPRVSCRYNKRKHKYRKFQAGIHTRDLAPTPALEENVLWYWGLYSFFSAIFIFPSQIFQRNKQHIPTTAVLSNQNLKHLFYCFRRLFRGSYGS